MAATLLTDQQPTPPLFSIPTICFSDFEKYSQVQFITQISAKLAYNSINSSQRSFPVLLAVFVAGPACYYSSNKFWAVITPHQPQYTPISIKKSPQKKNLVPTWAIQNEDG